MVWSLLNKLKIEPPYDPAIQLLATYLEKHFQKDISTLIFIAALFTAANTERQPQCPSVEEWIKNMWSTYTMEYYSAIKNEIMPFEATWMGLEMSVTKQNKPDRKTNII